MTTAIAFSFPWGRYHATPWGRNVNEAAVEWPPSPWRILRALYSAWQARAPHLDAGVVHGVLGALASPPEFVVPAHAEAHTRHYLPDVQHGVDKAIDAFAVFERDADIVARWNVDLDASARDVLAELAAAIPYLGRAESVCQARLLGSDEEPVGTRCSPGEASSEPRHLTLGQRPILAARQPLDISALTARTLDIRRGRRVLPAGARWVEYPIPTPVVASHVPRRLPRRPVTAVRWRISSPALPSRKAAVAMAHVLRHACMSCYGSDNVGDPSSVLAGKDAEGKPLRGHRHAHYLAFATDPATSGPNLLDTLVVWAPGGLRDEELTALSRLTKRGLRGFAHVPDFRACRLGLEALGEVADVAPELVGASRVWESVTPFAPARHARRQSWPDHVCDQIRAELGWRGLPAVEHVDLMGGDWLAYRRHRPGEPLAAARRATGLRLTFSDDVEGPILLGALSHFGLGLFAPTAS